MISRPLRSETEYRAALDEIEPFFRNEPRKGSREADRFDLLTLLIETYEEQHHPIGPPHPVEMIRHRMRTAGYTQADLALLLGSRARASEVLQKKRRLTIEMMRKLCREWKIPAETLLQPYRLVGERRLAGERQRRHPSPSLKRKAA